jgi:hypothetical protein
MDDPLFVRCRERLGELGRNPHRLVERNGPARDPLGERRTIDEQHQAMQACRNDTRAMTSLDVIALRFAI